MTAQARSHGVSALGPLHEAVARLTGLLALLFAALLGAFASLAYAPFHTLPVLAVSLTGLVWMIDGARSHKKWGKAVFARGWAFGFGFFLVSLHWTTAPFLVEPGKHAVFLWMPLLLLPGGMALIWGAACSMAAAFWSASPSRIFVFALFFALAEWVRGHLFGGFPWNLPGTAWPAGGAVSQMAAIGGVYWLSLLTIFICAAPAALVDTREWRGLAGRLGPALAAVVLLGLMWAWGGQRLGDAPEMSDQDIVLMDVGVPQNQKFLEGRPNPDVFREYLARLKKPDGQDGDIIVWPEGAIGGELLEDRNLAAVAEYLGERTLIAGTARERGAGGGEQNWYNSLAVLTRESNRTGAAGLYDKHRLVPFGELSAASIVPFGDMLSGLLPGALQRMAKSGFEPGSGPVIVYGDTVKPFIAMICYEALYPSVPRRAQLQAGHRADWMVVISNDGWFGSLIGPAQHYAQNRFRSIETGLPQVRVAGRGVSAVVDGHGRERVRAHYDPEAWDGPDGWAPRIVRTQLPQPEAVPFFQSRGGVVLFWLTLAFFSLLAFVFWRH